MIYVDIGQRAFSDASGINTLPEPDHMRLFHGTVETLRFQLLSGGSALVLNSSDTFVLKIDSDFDDTTPLMAYSTVFTIVDAAIGIVEGTVNLTSDDFGDKIGTAVFIKSYLRLERYLAGVTTPSVLVQDTIFTFNSIDSITALPQPGDPEYYNAAQVNAKFAALFDRTDPCAFTTTTETGETVTFTAADIGVDAEVCDFEVVQVLETAKKTVTNDAAISREWTSAGYVVTYAGGWPAGTWQLRAGKVKGDAGRDGMVYDRETMTGVTITASATPKTHYYTAESGDVLTTDWSAVNGKDATIWLKLTMPDPAVSITLPSDIDVWMDDFGNELAAAPDMSVPGTYWIFIHKDVSQVWATGKKVS